MNQKPKFKRRPVTGWLIFDKPYGMGSTDAVSLVKRLFRAEKVGHAGTLDPLASGVLPIALGEATKTVPYIMDGNKIYRFSVTWGEERETDDLEGGVLKTSNHRPTRSDVESLLPQFTGIISQIPPQFSAIKVNGQRAYDLARNGETVELQARDVEIERITLIEMNDNVSIFEIACGKGTYVRSLARDMGQLLGCYGYISALRRIYVAPFDESDCVTVEQLTQASDGDQDFTDLDHFLIDPIEALSDLAHIILDSQSVVRVRMGNHIMLSVEEFNEMQDGIEAYASFNGVLVAIGEIRQGCFHPRRVLNNLS